MSAKPMTVGLTDQAREDVPRMVAATRAGLERGYRKNLLFFGASGVLIAVAAGLSAGVPRLVFGGLVVVLLVLVALRVWSQRRYRRAAPGPLGDVALVVDDRQVQIWPFMRASEQVETFPLGTVTASVVRAGPSEDSSGTLPERLVITGPDHRSWQFYTTWLDVPAARVAARINRR
ncbi:MAG: hypothetical protein LBU50_03135 [Cellulomonas sp.]|jgi:hypothetical protein|nr:hypothetical protein [Cellulomonas sp.]